MPQAQSGFLVNDNLPRMSRSLRLLTKIKVDNEITPGTVHRSPDIYLIDGEMEKDGKNKTLCRRPSYEYSKVSFVIYSSQVCYY